MKVVISAPSLDPTQNVSGVSSVVNFIIEHNSRYEYVHFMLGKKDKEKGGLRRVVSILRARKEWKRVLSLQPDSLIHYSFPLSASSILRDPLFMYHAVRMHRKMVVHVHGGRFLTARFIPFPLKWILKWIFSWNVPFIVLSEGESKTLREKFGAENVYVLPNCPSLPKDMNEDVLSVNIERTQEVAGSNVSKRLVMGYLGRIEPNKGMTELLKACQQLKKDGISFLLRFAGQEEKEGEYLPIYRQRLGDNFEYVGLVSGETKDEFLRSLDVFVMPTYFEGLPMSLLECMGYGAVPVITPVGSVPDVVKSVSLKTPDTKGDENGVFVKVKNVESIVDAVSYLYNNRGVLKLLSKNARKAIWDNFSAERYIEQLNKIYNSL